jgi:alkylresorcinol/alkylpyrone synthase
MHRASRAQSSVSPQTGRASQGARRTAPTIAGFALALPEHRVDQARSVDELARLFPGESREFIAGIVHHSGVRERRMALPPERLLALPDFTARNAAWLEAAVEHCTRAGETALAAAGLTGDDVDAIVDVSCTGMAIPALDVHLAPRLGLRADCLRVPISAAGCAGGALGLNLAAQLAAERTVLLLAAEFCTLAFVPGETDRANLIAGALFGDGAAALVLTPGGAGPRIVAAGSHLFPDTRHAMGFEIGTHGLRIRLDRTLPVMLQRGLRPVVESFLAAHGLSMDDVGLHLVHTGGRRVLDVYEEIFGLPSDGLAASREALARYGNLSSASIFTVMHEAGRLGLRPPRGKFTLAVAFGPGLSVEMLLLEGFGA